jgi:RNA-binding protein
MTQLTPKQRAGLRSRANGLETIVQIGKNPISPELVKQVDDALTARELIKLQVLPSAPYTPREACGLLCEATGAAPVQVIGSRFVLYRPNPEKPVIRLD